MRDTVIESGGRVVLRQEIAGVLDTAIGPAGLSATALATWMDRLAAPLADLKLAHARSTLPHLRITEQSADIAQASAAFDRVATGAQTIIFCGTGGSSLGGQTIAQLNGWHIPGTTDARQRRRPRTRFYDNLDSETLTLALGQLD